MSCLTLLQIDLVNAKDLEILAQRIKVNLLMTFLLSILIMAQQNVQCMCKFCLKISKNWDSKLC